MTAFVTELSHGSVLSGDFSVGLAAVSLGLLVVVLTAQEMARANDPRGAMMPILRTVALPLLAAFAFVVGRRLLSMFAT